MTGTRSARTRPRDNARAHALNHRLPVLESLESRLLLSGSFAMPTLVRYQPHGKAFGAAPAAVAAEVSPAQMRQAYGVNSISINGIVGDGTGQTIAIIDAFRDPTLASDLATFDSDFGLQAPPNLIQIRQDGSTITPTNEPPVDTVDPSGGSWAIETSLDVEWAHVIAPNATILVVLADNNDAGLYTAVTTGADYPGVSVVSMSWGGSDLGGTDDSLFVAPGVTFVAATGDSGAYTKHGGALYPASSPNVLGIGGTTLYLSNGNYSSESAWSGGGGGLSTVEAEPAFQKAVVPSSITTTERALPDISLDADPNSGVAVIDSYDFGNTSPQQYGGTSLATPMWAALIAIANQERVDAGLQTMNQTLTGPTATASLIYNLPSTDFNDITTGSNGHSATVGYDLATGIGTPIANKLVAGLVGITATPQPSIASLTLNPSSITTAGSSTLTANNVTDPGATITNVAFYLETNGITGLQIGSDTAVSGTVTQNGNNWSITLTGLAAGTYTYYAVATDSAGYRSPTGTSAPSAVLTVTPAPQPAIASLTFNPTSVPTGTSATLTANNVTDPGATITTVAFYRESNSVAGLQTGGDTFIGGGTQSGNNWSISVSTGSLTPGAYTFYAVATDSASVSTPIGTSAPSASLTVTPAPQPAIASLTFNPTSVPVGTSTTLTANNVTDPGATITSVTFYQESNSTAGLQIGGDTQLTGTVSQNGSNWSISVPTGSLTPGTYTFYAVATDSASVSTPTGVAAVSAALTVVPPLTPGAGVINGGTAQRSMVTSISYTFNNAISSVNLSDISLTREHASAGTLTLAYALSNNNQTITFSWSGSGTLGGSLNDGVYDLLINTNAIVDNYGQSLSSAVTLNFWRFYGDFQGTGTITSRDLGIFDATYGLQPGDPGYNATADYYGTGVISSRDLGQFAARYGLSVASL